jgi:hypothetical protein
MWNTDVDEWINLQIWLSSQMKAKIFKWTPATWRSNRIAKKDSIRPRFGNPDPASPKQQERGTKSAEEDVQGPATPPGSLGEQHQVTEDAWKRV